MKVVESTVLVHSPKSLKGFSLANHQTIQWNIMPCMDVSELCSSIYLFKFFLKCICHFSVCLFVFYTIRLWIQVLMFNANDMYVDSSYTVSLHGSRNSSKSQITLHMMWVYEHHTIYMQCFTLRVCKSLIMSKEVLCKEPCNLALCICKIETGFNWYTYNEFILINFWTSFHETKMCK